MYIHLMSQHGSELFLQTFCEGWAAQPIPATARMHELYLTYSSAPCAAIYFLPSFASRWLLP